MPNASKEHLPILVHHIGSLGDTLASIPALRSIRSHFPSAQIHIVFDVQGDLRAAAIDVIRPLGLADEYIPYDHQTSVGGRMASYYRLWKQLTPRSYSQVISLLPSSRSRMSLWRDKLFYGLAGVWKSPTFKFVKFAADCQLKEAQRRLLRLSQIGIRPPAPGAYTIEVPIETDQKMQLWLQERRRLPDKPLIAICPGAKTRACIWPLDRFLDLGKKLLAAECEILLLGGSEHAGDAQRLLSAWNSGIDGVGQLSIFETASVLKRCAFMIGVDTGTTHLSAAVGTHCLAIFSQRETSPRWEPMGEGHQVIRHPVPCQDCRLAVCNTPGHPCLTGTTVETVLERALQMLASGPTHTYSRPPGLVFIANAKAAAQSGT